MADQPTLREIAERQEKRQAWRSGEWPPGPDPTVDEVPEGADIDALLALVREARDVVQDYQRRHAANAPEFSDCPCTACSGAGQFLAKVGED